MKKHRKLNKAVILYLKDRGLSITDVARHLRVTVSGASLMLAGKRRCTLETAVKIAKLCSCSVDNIYNTIPKKQKGKA